MLSEALYTKLQFEQDMLTVSDARALARRMVADGANIHKGVRATGLWLLDTEYRLGRLELEYRKRWADSQRTLGAYCGRRAQLDTVQAHLQANPRCEECIHTEPGLTRKVRYLRYLTGQILSGSPRRDIAPEEELIIAEPVLSEPATAVRRVGHLQYEMLVDSAWKPVAVEQVRALERVHYV